MVTIEKPGADRSIGDGVEDANMLALVEATTYTPSAAKTDALSPVCFRTQLRFPVFMRTENGICFTASARNLSVGGLGLQDFRPPSEVSGDITLQFSLPGTTHRIEVKGVVVWSRPGAIAGIRFTEISNFARERLRDWIATYGKAFTAD